MAKALQATGQDTTSSSRAGPELTETMMRSAKKRSAPLATSVMAAAALVLAGCATPSERNPPSTTLPLGLAAGDSSQMPFYRWPGRIPGEPGRVLRQEAVEVQDDMPDAEAALRVLYVSNDERWNSGPIPVSAMIFLPKGSPPEGGWPIFAWGHGTVGTADMCAPSHTGLRPRDAVYLNRWLEAGFAVVATDYQGLGGPGPHPYQFWQSEGRSILDSARAIRSLFPQGVARSVILGGQSQGSSAALGAAWLASEDTTDLAVRGAVVTGLGSYFPDGPIKLEPRMSANIFLSYASGGLRDDAPPIEELVTPQGAAILAATRSGCKDEIKEAAIESRVADLGQAFRIPLAALTELAVPLRQFPMRRVETPIFVATGLADATIEPEWQYASVSAMCISGNAVEWHPYARLGHDGAMHGSIEDSIDFARRALRGDAGLTNCTEIERPGPPQERDPQAPFNDD